MPVWKGWDETAVRKKPTATAAKMPGFTPINGGPAPASTAAANHRLHVDIDDHDIAGASGEDRYTSTALSKVAIQASASAAATAKKPMGKGKKRAATKSATTRCKRKKTADVSDGIAITKRFVPVLGDPQSSPTKATNAKASGIGPKKSADRQRSQRGGATRNSQAKTTTKGSSIISSPMLARTSVEALKASGSRGATLYSAGSEAAGDDHDIEFSEPLMRSTDSGKQHQVLAAAVCDDDDDDDLDAALESLAAHIDTSRPESKRRDPAKTGDQLPTLVSSDAATHSVAKRQQPKRKARQLIVEQIQTEDDFIISEASADEETAGITDAPGALEPAEDFPRRSLSPPPPRDRKLNMREVDAAEDYGGALLTDEERQLLQELKANTDDNAKPIVRSAFPKPVQDRSPIFGASNTTVLRTCFRIGEALNAGKQAVRNNKDVLLEIYARVTDSRRDGRNQHFVLHDLYHDKPPYLEGTFKLWDQSQLWEQDSRAFLTPRQGVVMCRLIAKMRWEGGFKWNLDILSIWQADWEDVEVVAGVYAKENEEMFMRNE